MSRIDSLGGFTLLLPPHERHEKEMDFWDCGGVLEFLPMIGDQSCFAFYRLLPSSTQDGEDESSLFPLLQTERERTRYPDLPLRRLLYNNTTDCIGLVIYYTNGLALRRLYYIIAHSLVVIQILLLSCCLLHCSSNYQITVLSSFPVLLHFHDNRSSSPVCIYASRKGQT